MVLSVICTEELSSKARKLRFKPEGVILFTIAEVWLPGCHRGLFPFFFLIWRVQPECF